MSRHGSYSTTSEKNPTLGLPNLKEEEADVLHQSDGLIRCQTMEGITEALQL
jgi:hypothetical protein